MFQCTSEPCELSVETLPWLRMEFASRAQETLLKTGVATWPCWPTVILSSLVICADGLCQLMSTLDE